MQLKHVLKQLHRAVLHLALHPQVNSSSHASGIAGNLVQIAFKQSDCIVHAEVLVGEVMCINYAPGLPAARSLLGSWHMRCEVPGRLWLR